jgi:transcriptional regulator with XRE-family HTH domain
MTTETSERFRKIICSRLDRIRKGKGLTQEDLAHKCGMTQSALQRIFSAKFAPSIDLVFIIAEAMGCVDEIFAKGEDTWKI